MCPRERTGREHARVFGNLIRNELLARNTRRRVVARFRVQGVTYLRIYRRIISRDFREEAFSERPPYRRINPRRIS
jgi:hypothetical protein